MSLHKYIERIKFIDYLIRKRATGNTEDLAQKLDLSVSGTFKFIKELKEEGFPICYSKKCKSYCYTKEGRLVSSLFEAEFEAEIDLTTMKKVTGGKSSFVELPHCNYTKVTNNNFMHQLQK